MTTTPAQHRAPRGPLLSLTRVFNRVALLLAGTRLLPLYGVLLHRGRRSGKTYRTPVVVRPIDGGFIIPMPWGEGTDWARNIRAAGECSVRWNGRDYQLTNPEVLDAATAMAAFSTVQRRGMQRFGIKQVMRLHFRA